MGQRKKELNGYFSFVSPNVGNGGVAGKDHALFGDFSKCHLATFGGISLIVDSFTDAGIGQTRMIVQSLIDGDCVQNDTAFVNLIEA